METILFISSSLLLGMLCAIPGILMGNYLSKKGLVRNGPWWVVFMTVVGIFGLRLLFPKSALSTTLIAVLLASISFYGNEVWLAMQRGKWWWKK